MKTNRVKSIELWRLFFAVLVLIWHTRYLPWFFDEKRILMSAHATDFFLLLSGFLMAKYAEKPLHGTLGEDCWHFILGKIGKFYPMYLLAIVFDLLSRWIATGNTVETGALRGSATSARGRTAWQRDAGHSHRRLMVSDGDGPRHGGAVSAAPGEQGCVSPCSGAAGQHVPLRMVLSGEGVDFLYNGL